VSCDNVQSTSLNTITGVFEAFADVGDRLPIDVCLGGFHVCWNVLGSYADYFQHSLQGESSFSIVNEFLSRNSGQYSFDLVNH
jgi:hypothetical protein